MVRRNFIIRFSVSFGLILILIWIMRKDTIIIVDILRKSNKWIFFAVLLINIPLSIALAYRFKIVMMGQDIVLSLKDAIYLTFIGYFFNNFLPTSIGGDVAKAYYISKRVPDKVSSYAGVIVDRLLGFFATLTLLLIGTIFPGKELQDNRVRYPVYGIFIISILAIFVLLRRNNNFLKQRSASSNLFDLIKEKIFILHSSISAYKEKPVLLLKSFWISFFLQAVAISTVYLFILSIGKDMSFIRLFVLVPLIWAVSMFPSLNGLGIREGAFVYFLKDYIGQENACAVSILWLAVILIYSIIGGLFHLAYHIETV